MLAERLHPDPIPSLTETPSMVRGRRFESVRGLCEVAANQPVLLALGAAVSGLSVHRASTARRDGLPRGAESQWCCGIAGLGSNASASRSETACSKLST